MGTPLTQCKVIIIAPSFITMSLYLYFNVLILQKPFSQGFKGLPIPFFDVVTVIVEVDILDPKRLYCLSLFFCLFFRLFPGPCLCFSFCLSLCLGSCPFLRFLSRLFLLGLCVNGRCLCLLLYNCWLLWTSCHKYRNH